MCECEITYNQFRTGYTFKEIRRMLKIESERKFRERNEIMYVTRHTVLGRWKQLKEEMWNQFQKDIERYGCSCSRNF
jgi:DNA-binding transcriptional MerR regulator